MKRYDLTDLEKQILVQLFESSAGNGHDFGFTDECSLPNKRSIPGVIASLSKKDIITLYPDHVNGKLIVQFTFTDLEAVRALVEEIERAST